MSAWAWLAVGALGATVCWLFVVARLLDVLAAQRQALTDAAMRASLALGQRDESDRQVRALLGQCERLAIQDSTSDFGYLVLKTDRWAINSPAELVAILEKCYELIEGHESRRPTPLWAERSRRYSERATDTFQGDVPIGGGALDAHDVAEQEAAFGAEHG